MTNLQLLKFIYQEECRYKNELLKLSRKRYCGDESDRDDVTHELAFNRGCLKAFQLVRERLDVTYPVLIQFTGGKRK